MEQILNHPAIVALTNEYIWLTDLAFNKLLRVYRPDDNEWLIHLYLFLGDENSAYHYVRLKHTRDRDSILKKCTYQKLPFPAAASLNRPQKVRDAEWLFTVFPLFRALGQTIYSFDPEHGIWTPPPDTLEYTRKQEVNVLNLLNMRLSYRFFYKYRFDIKKKYKRAIRHLIKVVPSLPTPVPGSLLFKDGFFSNNNFTRISNLGAVAQQFFVSAVAMNYQEDFSKEQIDELDRAFFVSCTSGFKKKLSNRLLGKISHNKEMFLRGKGSSAILTMLCATFPKDKVLLFDLYNNYKTRRSFTSIYYDVDAEVDPLLLEEYSTSISFRRAFIELLLH